MVEHESGGSNTFDLPEEVFQVLPSDPFEQLDVARKITSIALSTRVASLESESSSLRAELAEKDDLLSHLQSQLDSLDASLSDTSAKLAQAELDKEKLLEENAALSNTVRKLQRDVSKLEVFRKTLMQSLQEDNEETSAGHHHVIAKPTPSEDDAVLRPPSRTSLLRTVIQILRDLACCLGCFLHLRQPHPGLLLLVRHLYQPQVLPQEHHGDIQCHFLPLIGRLCFLLCLRTNIAQCLAQTLAQSLEKLELTGKNSSAKSGAVCLTSSLVHF